MNRLAEFPDKQKLLEWYDQKGDEKMHKVNGHFHTPYSFSAFENIPQVFEMANQEDVKILGINDFITMDGYQEFYENAVKNRKFPLFNIEFMGLLKEEQENAIRVNDPNNPGRTYFSGKGLNFPVTLDAEYQQKLDSVFQESLHQTKTMVEKLNTHLEALNLDFRIPFDHIKERYAKELVRERHIAKALRVAVFENYSSEEERSSILEKIYQDKPVKANMNDTAALDNEIRGNLLKAGGVAFVPEDPKAFLEIPEVIEIIINAGGIPCYPVLLDDKNGNFTEFEGNWEFLYERLLSLNVHSIELIPGRNKFEVLKDFVRFFKERNFVITFGTEHNTPKMQPLTVETGNKPLDEELKQVSYDGACVIAAHEYLHAQKDRGYVDEKGNPDKNNLDEYIKLGKAVVEKFIT